MVCFFFSSRRRHTRFKCDWSSDVCSSDLALSTAELFTFLVTESRHNSLLVIGTVTSDGADGVVHEPLASWETRAKEWTFPIIHVGTLDEALVREHVQSLLGEMHVSDEFGRWMQWESAGSPLNIRRIIYYLIVHR